MYIYIYINIYIYPLEPSEPDESTGGHTDGQMSCSESTGVSRAAAQTKCATWGGGLARILSRGWFGHQINHQFDHQQTGVSIHQRHSLAPSAPGELIAGQIEGQTDGQMSRSVGRAAAQTGCAAWGGGLASVLSVHSKP